MWAGARYGGCLKVTREQLTLGSGLQDRLTFSPQQVVSFAESGVRFLNWAVQINHNVPHYPREVKFRSFPFCNPRKLIGLIHATGFVEQGEDTVICLACGKAIPDNEARCPHCGWSYLKEQ